MNVGNQSTLNDLGALSSGLDAVDARVTASEADIEDIKNGAAVAGPYRLGIASITGGEIGAGYIHIKTKFRPGIDQRRFQLRVVGYEYNSGNNVECMFAGYCYGGGFTSAAASGTNLPNSIPAVYITSDGYVAMRVWFPSMLDMSLHVDSIATHDHGALIGSDIQLIQSNSVVEAL